MEYRLKRKKNSSKADKRSSSSDDSYGKKKRSRKGMSSKNSIHRSSSERRSRENRSRVLLQSDESERKKRSDDIQKGPKLIFDNYQHLSVQDSIKINNSNFPNKNPFTNNFRSSNESEEKKVQHKKPQMINNNKRLHTTTSNYLENYPNNEWSLRGSYMGKVSNPTNHQKNSDSKKSGHGMIPHRRFVEDNYHFKEDAMLDELEKSYSLLNFASSHEISHNYDNLVQDNEVTPPKPGDLHIFHGNQESHQMNKHHHPMKHKMLSMNNFGMVNAETLKKDEIQSVGKQQLMTKKKRGSNEHSNFYANNQAQAQNIRNNFRTAIEKKQFAVEDNEHDVNINVAVPTTSKDKYQELENHERKNKENGSSSYGLKQQKKFHSSNLSFLNNKSSSNSESDLNVRLFSLKNSKKGYSLFGRGSYMSNSSSASIQNLRSKVKKDTISGAGSDRTFKTHSHSFSYGGGGGNSLHHGKSSSKNSNHLGTSKQPGNKIKME